ncbi:MAG: sporulation protein YqfD [Candidatus Fimimonas sp.]
MARRVKICFSGLNLNRTICALSQKYALHDVDWQGKQCEITVDSKVFPQVVAFLEEKCYNITEIRYLGWNGALLFAKRHFTLPVFLLVALVALFALSNFCWKVEVSGDFSSQEVLQALQQCQVGVGSSLFGFSADKLENQLCTQLDAMYTVVTRKGSALYVNAVKKKTVQPPIDMHSRRDIVSTVSGKVLSVLCEQGTPVVCAGDFVNVGDVLILGQRTFNDGTQTDVYALGKVVVQPSCQGFAQFFGTATETVETGKSFCANVVVLFGKSYGKTPPFQSFRVEEKQISLSPLNVTVKRITYYETAEVTKTVSLEDCLPQLKEQALQQALLQANFLVTTTQYTVTDGGVFATVFGEIEIT